MQSHPKQVAATVVAAALIALTATAAFGAGGGGGGGGGGGCHHHNNCTTTTTKATTTTAKATTTTAKATTTTAKATTTTSVSTTTTSGSAPSGSWWKPAAAYLPWQWEIDHPLNTSSASDMGTGITAWNGDTAPSDNPVVYDIDGILNPASTVATLHADGFHAVCYIEVGTAGNYYTSADEGIPTTYYAQLSAAGDLGDKLAGYPERFLNINSPSTVSIIEAMINQQCAAKRFDAVETDLDETYSGSDGTTGFTETKADEEAYMTTLADYMHSLGLAWVIKNPDDTDDSYAADMEPLADLDLSEQCNQYGTCSALDSYLGHKPVLNAEYAPETTSEFCASDIKDGIMGEVFPVDLTGGRSPCN
jgi:hypothetical protein